MLIGMITEIISDQVSLKNSWEPHPVYPWGPEPPGLFRPFGGRYCYAKGGVCYGDECFRCFLGSLNRGLL